MRGRSGTGRSRRLPLPEPVEDPRGDGVDSESGREPVATDLVRSLIEVIQEVEGESTWVECSSGSGILACGQPGATLAGRDVVLAAMEVAAPIPEASANESLIYSLVFDSDGDPANDWVAQPPHDWD